MTTNENLTATKCHGHNLDHQGVKHICTDLCTDNECCKGEVAR